MEIYPLNERDLWTSDEIKFYFSSQCKKKKLIQVKPNTIYTNELGYGFDYNTVPDNFVPDSQSGECISSKPFYFSVKLREGNYSIRITCGSKKLTTITTIRAQSRKLLFEDITTAPGEFLTHSVSVNIKIPIIDKTGLTVNLKKREYKKLAWSDKLVLEFNGSAPSICELKIKRAPDVCTVFIAGNSTVVDQDDDPYASWPQMITKYFKENIIFSNYAESGLTLIDFIRDKRLTKILSVIMPGDYFFIEFGHLDKKNKLPNALTNFRLSLLSTINEIRKKKGLPVLVTPINRRYFDDNHFIVNTLGDYPDIIRDIADETSTVLIDLNKISKIFYEALGPEKSKLAFVFYPPNTWFNQMEELADNTHLNVYGAYELAKFMVADIQKKIPAIAKFLRPNYPQSNPYHPDDTDLVNLPASPLSPVIYDYENHI